jgi:hypothetical protein
MDPNKTREWSSQNNPAHRLDVGAKGGAQRSDKIVMAQPKPQTRPNMLRVRRWHSERMKERSAEASTKEK